MADIAEEQARAAEAIVSQGISELLGNANASLDADSAIVVAYAINTYIETMHRMGGRSRFTSGDVTRLFTIINLYLEGGMVKLQTKEDFAPKGKPTR